MNRGVLNGIENTGSPFSSRSNSTGRIGGGLGRLDGTMGLKRKGSVVATVVAAIGTDAALLSVSVSPMRLRRNVPVSVVGLTTGTDGGDGNWLRENWEYPDT